MFFAVRLFARLCSRLLRFDSPLAGKPFTLNFLNNKKHNALDDSTTDGVSERNLTFYILLVFNDYFFGILACQKEPFGCIAKVVVFGGKVLCEYPLIRQTMCKWTIKTFYCGCVLIPVETVAGAENIVVEFNHRQHRCVQNVLGCLHCQR